MAMFVGMAAANKDNSVEHITQRGLQNLVCNIFVNRPPFIMGNTDNYSPVNLGQK